MISTCGVFVFNQDDEVLVCHITGTPWSGHNWSIPKGMPDPDELHINAAIRELYEESSLVINPDDLIVGEPVIYESKKKTLHPFAIFINNPRTDLYCASMFESNGELLPEVDSFEWVHIEKAKTMLHESQVRAINQFICI